MSQAWGRGWRGVGGGREHRLGLEVAFDSLRPLASRRCDLTATDALWQDRPPIGGALSAL
jgi:hypothetical protein